MMSGLPALPMPTIRPSRTPTSALIDAPVVEDQRAGDHQVGGALRAGGARLAHRLTDHLAAAEHHLVAAPRAAAAGPRSTRIDEQVGVGEPDAVTGRWGRTESGVGRERSTAPGPGHRHLRCSCAESVARTTFAAHGSAEPPHSRSPGTVLGPAQLHQIDTVALHPRLETDGGAGGAPPGACPVGEPRGRTASAGLVAAKW